LKSQQNPVCALKQSVVKVPCNPCALAHAGLERQVELMLQLPDTPQVHRPQQRQQDARAESAKPIRLVVRWGNGELDGISLLVPNATVVARHHAKPVGAWCEIGVLCMSHVDYLFPVMILPL